MRLKELHNYIKEKQGASMSEILAESQMDPPVIEGMLQTLMAKGRIETLSSQPVGQCGGCGHKKGCALAGSSISECQGAVEYFAPVMQEET